MPPRKILITGVYGLIGGVVHEHLIRWPDRYDVYGLARRRQPSIRVPDSLAVNVPEEKFTLSDLSDLEQATQAVRGMDVVVHMAADPDGSRGWESVLHSNVIATYHVLEACRQAGVKRLIFASSIQVSSGYLREEPYRTAVYEAKGDASQIRPVEHDVPVRPLNIYAASKVWGEALARVYADVHGLSCICLRIAWVNPENRPRPGSRTHDWFSYRDVADLIQRCIDAPDTLRFDIFYGVSNDERRWVDLEHPRQVLGFVPQDRAEEA